MRSYGDIPTIHRKQVEDLKSLEDWLHHNEATVPVLSLAKGMTCIAMDYYALEFEEEGDRILRFVESRCPGYFKGPFLSHIERDDEFAFLIAMLAQNPLCLSMMMSLGLKDGQI